MIVPDRLEHIGGSGRLNACCADASNRVRRSYDDTGRQDLVIERCRVCDRRHFIAIAEPGRLGFVGGAVAG